MVKIKGQKIEGRNTEVIPILRPSGNVYFIAQALESYDEFDKLCPEPKPKMLKKPDGSEIPDPKDSTLQERIDKHNEMRTNYTVLKCLEATEDLEWESVDMTKPDTWRNWRTELEESGFSQIELGRVLGGVLTANSLDAEAIEAAKKDFLLQQSQNMLQS